MKLGLAQGLTCVSKCVGIHLLSYILNTKSLCVSVLFNPRVINTEKIDWSKLFVSVGTHA